MMGRREVAVCIFAALSFFFRYVCVDVSSFVIIIVIVIFVIVIVVGLGKRVFSHQSRFSLGFCYLVFCFCSLFYRVKHVQMPIEYVRGTQFNDSPPR